VWGLKIKQDFGGVFSTSKRYLREKFQTTKIFSGCLLGAIKSLFAGVVDNTFSKFVESDGTNAK